jgi:hypothetical protein
MNSNTVVAKGFGFTPGCEPGWEVSTLVAKGLGFDPGCEVTIFVANGFGW